MSTSSRNSYLKKKNLGVDGHLQGTYFVIYPFQIEFLKNVNFMTAYYFQKNFQIIGEIDTLIPPSKKGQIYKLDSPKNTIEFRLFTEKNLVYKWSLYRRYDQGEQEFLNSCTINLKEVVVNFVMPKNSRAVRTQDSLLDLGFVNKVLKSKFSDEIILSFVLYVSDDLKQIQGDLQKKYFKQPSELNPMPSLKLRTKVSSQQKLELEKTVKHQSNRENNEELSQNSNNVNSLENISKNSNKAESLVKQPRQNVKSEQIVDQIEQNAEEEKNDLDEFKLIERKSKKSQKIEDNQKDNLGDNEFKNPDDFNDEGYLKLDSDQGRYKQQGIDRKLEQEQLDVISEERRSASRGTEVKQIPNLQISGSKKKSNQGLQKGKLNLFPIESEKGQKFLTQLQRFHTEIMESPGAKKKLLLLLLIVILCVVLILSGIDTKKRKRRRK